MFIFAKTQKIMISRKKSEELYNVSKELFPGGVNSPVRAFKSVEGVPLFIEKGDGCRTWDADGNEFIDFCCSWGPLILGHNNAHVKQKVIAAIENGMSFGAPTKAENTLAKLILDNHSYIEKIRFVSSGTEAVMSAIRLARGYTKRNKILKFEGCYHGHADSLLVKAGSGLVTFGETSSAGIPEAFVNETVVVPLNNIQAVIQAFEQFKDDIACVIIEPVPANNGLLLQDENFLRCLKCQCEKNGALLIFDEVISGFRVGFEGAAGYYKIQPDIITFGKIIGGGLPVGAYGASKEIMAKISPDGDVYQAGTLSGNPVAMSAGAAQLEMCLKPDFYKIQEEKTVFFTDIIKKHIKGKNYKANVQNIGSIFWIAFSENTIHSAEEIDPASMQYFKKLHSYLLDNGVYFGPSGYEVGFVSEAHTYEDLKKAAEIICAGLDIAMN